MINGAHILIYSKDPVADRAFFRDVLGFRFVNVGEDWLIFALPPSELALHPGEGDFIQRHAEHSMLGAVVYFMCDDLKETVQSLKAKKVKCSKVTKAPWGSKTTLRLPSGGEVGLYQPTHETAIELGKR
jgi:catechol 2,3-dioxygenase-like lactoylglutathione lyase family enzyme